MTLMSAALAAAPATTTKATSRRSADRSNMTRLPADNGRRQQCPMKFGVRLGTYRSATGAAAQLLHIHLQRGDEGFLRDVDLAELAHLLFAFALLVEQFA